MGQKSELAFSIYLNKFLDDEFGNILDSDQPSWDILFEIAFQTDPFAFFEAKHDHLQHLSDIYNQIKELELLKKYAKKSYIAKLKLLKEEKRKNNTRYFLNSDGSIRSEKNENNFYQEFFKKYPELDVYINSINFQFLLDVINDSWLKSSKCESDKNFPKYMDLMNHKKQIRLQAEEERLLEIKLGEAIAKQEEYDSEIGYDPYDPRQEYVYSDETAFIEPYVYAERAYRAIAKKRTLGKNCKPDNPKNSTRYVIYKKKFIEFESSGIKKNKITREKYQEFIFRENEIISVTSSELENLVLNTDLFGNFSKNRFYDFGENYTAVQGNYEGCQLKSYICMTYPEGQILKKNLEKFGYKESEVVEGYNQFLNQKFKTNEELSIFTEQASIDYAEEWERENEDV